jgi:hypothetical protein
MSWEKTVWPSVHSSLSTWPKEAEITLQALAQSEQAEIEKSRKPT